MDHNKIIRNAVSSILKPNGLFQKGTSRAWIDDNGWFLILAEFQPSGWDKGSYLNVGIHFLWCSDETLAFSYSNDGSRVNDLVTFDGNEENFFLDMQGLANRAMEKVEEYRRFRDLEYACAARLNSEFGVEEHKLYRKMMICGLCRDPRAVHYFEKLRELTYEPGFAWIQQIKDELDETIAPIIDDPQALYAYILGKIRGSRNILRGKSSMKKLKQSFPFNGENL
jgi:hypothetical protein